MFHDHVDHQLSNSGDDTKTIRCRWVVQKKKGKLNRASGLRRATRELLSDAAMDCRRPTRGLR
jgi:hypothetical protein